MSFKSNSLPIAALTLMIAMGAPAQANTTITFDEFGAGADTQVSNGYQGFNWNNFFAVNPANDSWLLNSGYGAGVVSSTNVAYNGWGTPANFSSVSGVFTLGSLFVTAAWYDGLNVTLNGLHNGVTLFTTTFTPSATTPSYKVLNWSGIDTVALSTSGGTQHSGYSGSGGHVAIDNITIGTVATPGPIAGAGLPVLFGGIGFAAWRRRRAA